MDSRFRSAWALGVLLCLVSVGLMAPASASTPPATVTGLAARTTDSSAVLTWAKAKNATHYRVCLVTTRTSSACLRSSDRTTGTTWSFSGLRPTADTDYYFSVKSYNGTRSRISELKGFNLQAPGQPAPVTGVTQTVSSSAATISWAASSGAKAYSLCLSGSESLTRCSRETPQSTALTTTVSGLKPTAGGDYFYTVVAHNGTATSRSDVQRIDLPVAAVGRVTATKGGSGVINARWPAATNAEQYELQLATTSSMTKGLRSYVSTTSSTSRSGLPLGTTYYYRVRGLNGAVKGAFSAVHAVRLPSDPARVTVLTFNLCGQDKCVTRSNGMKRWSTRRTYAGKLVRDAGAGIIATQESHDVDTQFGRELPGYGLAAYYSAKSLFYDTAKYDVTRHGKITLNSAEKKYAVWGQFRDKVTRTEFIVVDAHLQPFKGQTKDDMRAAQTNVLLDKVESLNDAKVPVVYAGDFNSNKSNADQDRYKGGYDAPRQVFTSAGIPDALTKAKNPVHADFNSANQAVNPPMRHGDHVDHIYVTPTIAVDAWRVVVSMASGGRTYATPFASDHNPVRAVLTVPGR